jgi:hypothetical protein
MPDTVGSSLAKIFARFAFFGVFRKTRNRRERPVQALGN